MLKLQFDWYIFKFSEIVNKCLWPGWKWVEMCLYLAKIFEKLIVVCTPCENSLDILLLVFQKILLMCEPGY